MHEKGFTAVGVSEVCANAGVNKGSFYHFFPSKQDLGLAVIDSFRESFSEHLDDLTRGQGLPLDRLRAFFDRNYRQHNELKEQCGKVLGCPLGNLALEMSTQDPQIRERIRASFERQVDRFELVIAEAVERGDLPAQDSRASARSVISLLEGGILMAKIGDDPGLLAGLGDAAMRLLGASENS